jgi:hypothetical protein
VRVDLKDTKFIPEHRFVKKFLNKYELTDLDALWREIVERFENRQKQPKLVVEKRSKV